MNSMQLVSPTTDYKIQYLEMLMEWKSTNENLVPFPLNFDTSNFSDFVNKCNRSKIECNEGFVHHSTFWLIHNNEVIGVSNLRHYLNDKLLINGGHIGYGIRPSFRRQGHATKILELSLKEAKKIGIEKVLLSCDKDNLGSIKTILNNGGVLWKEYFITDVPTQSYWIDIK